MILRSSLILAAAAAAVCLAVSSGFAAPLSRTTASGTFVDVSGTSHKWEINDNHALEWDGRPFAPIGVVFPSAFLSGSPTDDNWRADIAALRQLKKAGISQLLIQPTGGAGCLDDLPPSTIQGLLDVLDASGFTYGIDLDGAPGNSWDASLINPAIYRSPAPAAGSTVTFRNIPDVERAAYFLVSSPEGRVIASGDAAVQDNRSVSVSLPADAGGAGTVLLVYPIVKMSPNGAEGRRIPDVWTSADTYRDSTLLFLSRLHFGKGFRFFQDPIRVGQALTTEADGGILPASDNFRIQFQAWLMHKYNASVVQLRSAWGIKNNDITDYATAVRCQALWFESKGLALMMDPTTSKTYEVIPGNSHYWQDVRGFEAETILRDMNSMADALKQGVANVPVVYSWSSNSPVYVNLDSTGFDGLCVNARRHGDQIVQDGAGDAFAAVEQSRRTQWFFVCARASEATAASSLVASNGSAGRAALTADRAAAESIGAKGFFLEPPDAQGWSDADSPWLKWVRADYASRSVDAEAFAAAKPRTIFYPVNIALHHPAVQQLAPGVWWLPTFQEGVETDLGRTLYGYSLKNGSGVPTYVVWSASSSEAAAKFSFPKGSNPDVRNPDGTPAPFSSNKGTASIAFGPQPKLISGVSALPLPDGASDTEIAEAARLIDLAEKAKIPVSTFSQRLFYIRSTLMPTGKGGDPLPSYLMLKHLVDELTQITKPYTWIEGEAAAQQSFESVVSSSDASSKSFLWLDTRQAASASDGGYFATYHFTVNAPAEYAIWAAIAPSPPGSANTSPISFRVDQQPPADVSQPITAGEPYGTLPFDNGPVGGAFTWCNLGSAELTAGDHTLTITATGKAAGTDRYTLGIDAINITRAPFTPNGGDMPSF